MSLHIEWSDTTVLPSLITEDDDFYDGNGTQLTDGNVGLKIGVFDGAVVEGTRDELAAWLRHGLTLVEQS